MTKISYIRNENISYVNFIMRRLLQTGHAVYECPRNARNLLHCCGMSQVLAKPTRSFASDNNAGIHPEVLDAIARANQGHVIAYGADPYTRSAIAKFEEHFGRDVDVFFTFNGTGANVLGLQALTLPYHAILCSDYAHIYMDECGAPEKHTGCKLIPLPNRDGKITADAVCRSYHGIGDQHHVQPRVISITQSTEMGTVYQTEEIQALARFAHEHDMFLHVDGARIANAAASLGQTLRQATRDLGVDVLSFGGTKNGIMGGEAVIFFDRGRSQDFCFLRKQGMQLASKMRFIAVQFEALLTNDLWRRSAEHSNGMARLLEQELRQIPQVRVVWKVESNGVFAQIPRHAIDKIKERYFFYPWIEEECIVRWMCSFDTTEEDVRDFAAVVAATVKG
jgi:threonine aldolase